jgi:hypothetical protein
MVAVGILMDMRFGWQESIGWLSYAMVLSLWPGAVQQ